MGTDQQEWTVLSMLEWATDYFEKKDIPDARHSIEWLMAETLDVKRLDLYLLFERPLSPAELDELRPLVKRRARHEPLQYITGYSEFINAHIAVNPDVLIPRIETEQLVEIILEDRPDRPPLAALDIGTGSGCIPVALKMERPSWNITAMEISEKALTVARDNARRNKVEIEFIKGNFRRPQQLFSSRFDLIVSNPPYILPQEQSSLAPQVKNHEPAEALFCKNVTLIYESIARFSVNHLQPDGTLYVEINESCADQILDCFPSQNWQTTLIKDYDRKPRFIRAELQ